MVSTLIIFALVNFISIPTDMIHSIDSNTIYVKKCVDFSLTGTGDDPQWEQTDWINMPVLDKTENAYKTRFKMLYSDKGIYVLGHCEDRIISTEYKTDQGDIWNGDVFEVFLQTDESNPLYFEYEINPLSAELAILVPNNEGAFFGWSPWHYEGDRKIKKAVKIHDGKAVSGEKISGWTAEMFFPFALFQGLKNSPPKAGSQWKGNFYRMDYDTGEQIKWTWKPVEESFHEYNKFGSIIFE